MFLPNLKSKCVLGLLVLSLCLVMVSISLIKIVIPRVIEDEIAKNVYLKKNTEQYDRFLELPFPVDFKVYIFNVENPEAVENGTKPLLREIGPYIYKQYRKKSVISTDEDEDTVTYTQTEEFRFDGEASNGLSDDDYVTVLNAPLLSILQIAENYGQAGTISGCLDEIFPNYTGTFIRVTVRELLFDGIHFCPKRLSWCELRKAIACKIAQSRRNVERLPDGSLKFSLFNYKAKSNDGVYTVKRGIKDIQSVGQIVKWNNVTHTDFWGRNSSCDLVTGNDATLFPPQIRKDSVFQSYATDICRLVEIDFLREDSYKGIDGFVFSTNQSTLRSSTALTADDCFCTKQTRGPDGWPSCFLDGVIDMQPCTRVPVLLSFPHFLWADEHYLSQVDGLTPNEELHRTFLLVEPNTGTPLVGAKRIQINAVLRPTGKVGALNSVRRAVVPLLWIDEGVALPDEYVDKLNDMYFNKVKIADIAKWSFLAISCVLSAIFGSYFIFKQCG